MGDKYGEVFTQDLPQQPPLYIVSSHRLTHELCDQKRFHKVLHPSLESIREFAGNGLFTSYHDEPEWGQAHRILMPAFNPAALAQMYEGMADVAEQLMLKWSRTRDDEAVDIPGDCTRLTLDTIALCSFSYRFNSFYSEKLHPFVDAMVNGLKDSGKRSHMPDLVNKLNVPGSRRYFRDIATMNETVDSLIAERKAKPHDPGYEDVLDVMLNASDPQSGKSLSDENLRYQLITFLIAGHETTSGLLSFVVYELIKNPRVFKKARDIVDGVLNGRFPEHPDLKKLGYLDQILREGLRLYPTAPAFAVTPSETTTVGQDDAHRGFEVSPGDVLLILLGRMHRDPDVWDDPEEFRPERFDFENAKGIPQHAWKPFGNGQRSCLGRAFALQEATMVLALMVQHFDFEFDDPNYQLDVVDGITSKPKELFVKVKNRPSHAFKGRIREGHNEDDADVNSTTQVDMAEPNGHSVQIAVGSNAGTCWAMAKKLRTFAERQGYETEVLDLDEIVGKVQKSDPVIIVTSSYEGLPPDNAAKFVDWITSTDSSFESVRYAVFGSGNSEWASTFQRIPTLIDERLSALGASRLVERGVGDVRGDYSSRFEEWAENLWTSISSEYGLEHTVNTDEGLVLEETPDRSRSLDFSSSEGAESDGFLAGKVVRNETLSTAKEDNGPIRVKKHIEFELPRGRTFSTGDYLEVLPHNPVEQVSRVLRMYGLLGDSKVAVKNQHPFLPYNVPLTYREILTDYVQLNSLPSQRFMRKLAVNCPCPPEREKLEKLAGEDYDSEIQHKRMSLVDVIEAFPSARPAFAVFLNELGPMTPRRYSISSSATLEPNRPAITFSVIDEPAWSGHGNFSGVASTYLDTAEVGSNARVRVVEGNKHFRPDSETSAPAILIGAGTGIAPLRAFMQDFEVLHENQQGSGGERAILYYGCHGKDSDYLYSEELRRWAQKNIVSVRPVFSRHPEPSEDGDLRYVQHRLWQDREEIVGLCRSGSKVLVCGDAERLAPAVERTFAEMFADVAGMSLEQAESHVEQMQRKDFSYVADVFE